MILGFSLFGWMIIAVFYALCASALLLLWRFVRSSSVGRVLVAALAVLALIAPIADEIWISWQFNELCKGAGVDVIRKVTVEGYLDDTSRSSASHGEEFKITDANAIRDLDRAGYRFTESLFSDGKVRHLERVPDGILVTILDRPTARYVYRHAYQPTQYRTEKLVGWKIGKSGYVVVDSANGEVLGRDTRFIRHPGWIESLWVRFLGTGMIACEGSAPASTDLRYSLYRYVLIPPTRQ